MASVQDLIRAANAARTYYTQATKAQNQTKTVTRAANAARTYYKQATKPTYTAPARSSSSSRSSSSGSSGSSRSSSGSSGYSGGGSSSYSGGGGGGGGGSFAAAAPAPPPPTPIDIPDPMADSTYQRQTGELSRAMADFQAQQGLAKSQYDTQYGMGLRRLGWDQQAGNQSGFANRALPEGGGWSRNLPGAYGQSYDSNENDFAGRGLYNSGVYSKSVSNLNDDFTDRKNTMDVAKTDWQSTQDMNRKNLENSQETTRQTALTDAIARIAAQYGVNLSDVTPGKSNQVMR